MHLCHGIVSDYGFRRQKTHFVVCFVYQFDSLYHVFKITPKTLSSEDFLFAFLCFSFYGNARSLHQWHHCFTYFKSDQHYLLYFTHCIHISISILAFAFVWNETRVCVFVLWRFCFEDKRKTFSFSFRIPIQKCKSFDFYCYKCLKCTKYGFFLFKLCLEFFLQKLFLENLCTDIQNASK